MTNEVRTTDATTGAQKGVKLERFDLVPVGPITELARHYGMGASKYEDRNWELGYDWSKSYQAAMRHITQFWGGEDYDPDPFYDDFPENLRPKHVTAAAWHCMALSQFMDQHREKDNRPALWIGDKLYPVGPPATADKPLGQHGQDDHDADMYRQGYEAGEHSPRRRDLLVEFLEWATTREHDPMVGGVNGAVDLYYEEAKKQ